MILSIYQSLLWLYPAGVREEFGPEMTAVFLEARAAARAQGGWVYARFCVREVCGMMGGLMGAGGVFRYQRWIGALALLGAFAGGGLMWTESREPYVSRAILHVTRASIPQSVVGSEPIDVATVTAAANDMLSRVSLADLVRTLDLYHDERKRMPMEDVVEEMRKQIRLKDVAGGWLLSFTYEDNVKAQRVTGALVSRLIEGVTSQRSAAVAQTEEFLEAMSDSAGQEMIKAQRALREARQNGGATERLELDAAQTRRQYESLRDKRAEAHLRRRIEERKQGPMLQLLDPGSMPAERLARQFAPWSILLGAVGGLLVGALAGSFSAWLYAWWPRRRPATAL